MVRWTDMYYRVVDSCLPKSSLEAGRIKNFGLAKFPEIDELDFVVWNRGWQDGWLSSKHTLKLDVTPILFSTTLFV